MLLSVKERIQLLNLAATAAGSLMTMRLVRDFQVALGFSEEDLAVLHLEESDGQVRWQEGVPPKEVPVGPALKKAIAQWFDPKAITLDLLPLYERFVPAEEEG